MLELAYSLLLIGLRIRKRALKMSESRVCQIICWIEKFLVQIIISLYFLFRRMKEPVKKWKSSIKISVSIFFCSRLLFSQFHKAASWIRKVDCEDVHIINPLKNIIRCIFISLWNLIFFQFLHPEWNSDVKESLFLVFRKTKICYLLYDLLLKLLFIVASFVNRFLIVLLNFHT